MNNIPPILYRDEPYKICPVCGKEYSRRIKPDGTKEAYGMFVGRIYCSPECTKKGLKEYRSNLTKTNNSFSRKGKIPHNKGVYTSNSYSTIHKWLVTNFKKSGKCEQCGKECRTTWANMKEEYTRDKENYKELCYHCHNLHDRRKSKVL